MVRDVLGFGLTTGLLLSLTSLGGAGCLRVQCDCEAEGITLAFEDATGAPVAVPTPRVTVDGVPATVTRYGCVAVDTATAPEDCDVWRGEWDGDSPEEGAVISVTVEGASGGPIDETFLSPGPSGAGCCGRGLWMQETIVVP